MINGAPTRTRVSFEINALGTEHRKNIVTEKENAATSAKVNGAKDVVESVCFGGEYIAFFPILAMHWGVLA